MKSRLECEEGCKPDTDTPFYYGSSCTFIEEGVLAYADGEPSNRFTDGIAGVPATILEELEGHGLDCLHCIVCGAPVMQSWHTVCG